MSFETTRPTTAGSVNRGTVVELLTRLRRDHPSGRLTVVLDNARYFRNRVVFGVARRLRIHLLFLPPYSPNLNLIERVWKFVKKVALQGRYQPDFAGFQTAIDRILDGLDGEYETRCRACSPGISRCLMIRQSAPLEVYLH